MNHEVISTQSYSDLSLAALKKSRKQIEQDAQILANRIALLKQEELKSWKKIEETKKKAREVYLQKKRHEERQQEKLRKIQTEKQLKMQYMELRKQSQQEREFIREAIQQQKMQEINQIKQLREINDRKRREIQLKQQEEKLLKHDVIKQQLESAKIKKQAFFEGKINLVKRKKELMKKDEEKLKNQRELEVLNMERLELELIKKLQQTQQIQKAAFEELEVALAEKPTDYERKFIANNKTPKRQERASTGSSGMLSVKHSDKNPPGLLEKSQEINTEQFFINKQNIKGQPDRQVEEVEKVEERQVQLKPETEQTKENLQAEGKDDNQEDKGNNQENEPENRE